MQNQDNYYMLNETPSPSGSPSLMSTDPDSTGQDAGIPSNTSAREMAQPNEQAPNVIVIFHVLI